MATGKKRISQHNKLKSAARYKTKPARTRKAPKKGKTTIRPTGNPFKGKVGVKIKRTF